MSHSSGLILSCKLAGALGYGLEYNGIRVTGDETRLWVPIVRAMLSELGVLCVVRKAPLARVLNSRPRIDEDCTNVLLGGHSCLNYSPAA